MFLPAASLLTSHLGQSDRGPSPRLWRHAFQAKASTDGQGGGYLFFDDFDQFQGVTLTTAAAQLQPGKGWFAYIEVDATVGSILPVATQGINPGVIKLLTSTDAADGDNHDTVLTSGGNAGTLAMISDTAGVDKVLAYEVRFKLPSVTNGDGSIFLGLGEEGLAAANTPIVDSSGHTLSDDDLIGFFIGEDDNDALKFKYRKNGAALQSVLTYGTALVADTWYKAGFVYDPRGAASKRITIYVENEEQSTYVTADNIAASTFPDGEELALVNAIKGSGDNDPQHFFIDWVALYQGN